MTQWDVSHADILDVQAEGLICSANPYLNLSGGVGGAFGLRYGSRMQVYLHQYLRDQGLLCVPRSQTIIAPSCGSPYKAVAHAVSIDVFYDTNPEAILRTYEDALRQLADHDCSTIAAACLGCGYGRIPIAQFAGVAVALSKQHYQGVDRVTFVTTNVDLADKIRGAWDQAID